MAGAESSLRVGQGWDIHRLVPGRPLRLGGVTVPHSHGLLGHSDGDAVLHAVADALLGAVAAGDIGQHFPDTDPRYRDADSAARPFGRSSSKASCAASPAWCSLRCFTSSPSRSGTAPRALIGNSSASPRAMP